MTQLANDRRARRGYAIMAVLLLVALAIINVDTIADRFRDYIDVVALVPETRGVRVGSPVVVEGVEAGRVTALHFASGTGPAVAVHLRLDEDVASVVRQGSRAYTAKRRVIGEPMLVLGAAPATSPPLASGDTLQADARPTLTELIDRGADFPGALDSLATVVRELEALAELRGPAVGTMVDRLATLTDEAGALRADLDGGSIDRFLADPTIAQRVARLRLRAAELADGARGLSRYGGGDSELGQRMTGLAERADRLDAALDALAASLAGGSGVVGRMAVDTALTVAIEGVRAQIDSLRADGMGFGLRMILP